MFFTVAVLTVLMLMDGAILSNSVFFCVFILLHRHILCIKMDIKSRLKVWQEKIFFIKQNGLRAFHTEAGLT